MQYQRFGVPYRDTTLIGDSVPTGSVPTVLLLHGAGTSHRGRHATLQQTLAQAGIGSASFDKIGHGETGGDLEASSLHDRTNQAVKVIEHLGIQEPFGLFGGSMGAYTELRLTEIYQINKLVLTVPAVYAADTYNLPFGGGFSERIRQNESWRETDAWEIISRFTGDLLIVTAEHDEVIPVQIPQTLYNSATNARSRALYQIDGAPHRYWDYLNAPEHASQRSDYLDQLCTFFTH